MLACGLARPSARLLRAYNDSAYCFLPAVNARFLSNEVWASAAMNGACLGT